MTNYIEKFNLPVVVVPDDAYDAIRYALLHQHEKAQRNCVHVEGPHGQNDIMIFRGVVIRPKTKDDWIKAKTDAAKAASDEGDKQ